MNFTANKQNSQPLYNADQLSPILWKPRKRARSTLNRLKPPQQYNDGFSNLLDVSFRSSLRSSRVRRKSDENMEEVQKIKDQIIHSFREGKFDALPNKNQKPTVFYYQKVEVSHVSPARQSCSSCSSKSSKKQQKIPSEKKSIINQLQLPVDEIKERSFFGSDISNQNQEQSSLSQLMQISIGAPKFFNNSKQAQYDRIRDAFNAFYSYMERHKNFEFMHEKVLTHLFEEVKNYQTEGLKMLNQTIYYLEFVVIEISSSRYQTKSKKDFQNDNKYRKVFKQVQKLKKDENGNFKLALFIDNEIVPKLQLLKSSYQKKMKQHSQRIRRQEEYYRKVCSSFIRAISKINKVFQANLNKADKFEEMFEEFLNFTQKDQKLLKAMKYWGKSIEKFVGQINYVDCQMLQEFEKVISQYQNYGIEGDNTFILEFKKYETDHWPKYVRDGIQLFRLCNFDDIKFIKASLSSVEKITNKESSILVNNDFEDFFQMTYIPVLVGQPLKLLSTLVRKQFSLKNKNDVIVLQTICDNFIQFNKKTYKIENLFLKSNISGFQIADQVLEIHVMDRGYIYDSERVFNWVLTQKEACQQLYRLLY